MSFQVNSADLKDGTEIKESVATAEEEFQDSTAEESERKLVPENGEKLKNSRSEKLKIKPIPKSMEEFKYARDEKLRKFVFEDKEEFQEPRAGMPERSFKTENSELIYKRGGGLSGFRNYCSFEEVKVNVNVFLLSTSSNPFLRGLLEVERRKTFNLEDKDEDKDISRTQSMENLLLMQKPQHH